MRTAALLLRILATVTGVNRLLRWHDDRLCAWPRVTADDECDVA